MHRRDVLQAIGTGVTIGLAGCSGNGNGNGGDSDVSGSSGGPETATSTPTDTADPTETPSPTPTQTSESQFSTQGNDSELIDKSAESLVLTESEIPRDNYSLDSTQGGEDSFGKFFESEGGSAELWIQAEIYDDVSAAEERYSYVTHERHVGGSPSEGRDKELDIGIESHFSSGTFDDNSYTSYIRIRDANAFGFLSWFTSDELIELQEIGSLAVTMHQKWR